MIGVIRSKRAVPAANDRPVGLKRALDGFDGAMKRDGLRPIPSHSSTGGDLPEFHDHLVEKRWAVLLVIDYGTVARLAPRVWSSTSFRGNHTILVNGGRDRARLSAVGTAPVSPDQGAAPPGPSLAGPLL